VFLFFLVPEGLPPWLVFAVASASGSVARNNLRPRCGFTGDDVWLALLGEGMLATLLSFSELNRLGRLNRRFRRLHEGAWPAIWRARSKTCGSAELGRMLRLAVTRGKAAHVRELVRPMAEQGDAWEKMQDLNDEPSYLFLAVEEGHVEVVKALLEVGGRELVMLTADNGVSRLYMSAQNGHLDVVKVLLEAGGRELLMLTRPDGASCLSIARRTNQGEVCRVLEMECQNAGLSPKEKPILKRG